MEPEKDPLTLVRAFIRLVGEGRAGAENTCLALVGSGSQYEQVRREIEDAGLGGRVWLPGERDDVPEILRALDLFVLPSLAEGISNTVLEALASGVPVVATRVGGNPELVVDGECGALVPPGDSGSLAEAVSGCLRDPERLAGLGAAARERAVGRFSIDAMVDAYLGVYRRVLGMSAEDPEEDAVMGKAVR